MTNKTDKEKDRPREGVEREDDQVLVDTRESPKTKSKSAPDSARTGRPIIGGGKSDE
jgi:hypothetical protein